MKAWAALTSLREVWSSILPSSTKRNLFRSLVEPILGYGIVGWPLHSTQAQRVDAAYGRMLRYALGLRSAFLSHEVFPTERIYGTGTPHGIPFLSSELRARRIGLLGHMVRQQVEGRARHDALQLLVWDPSYLFKKKRGRRATLLRELCIDTETGDIAEALELLRERDAARKTRARTLARAQSDAWGRVTRRRDRRQLLVTPSGDKE